MESDFISTRFKRLFAPATPSLSSALLNDRRQLQWPDASAKGVLTARTGFPFLETSLVNSGFERSHSVFSRVVVHTSSPILHTIVGGFTGNQHVMRMALTQTGAGNAYKASTIVHILNGCSTAVTHGLRSE